MIGNNQTATSRPPTSRPSPMTSTFAPTTRPPPTTTTTASSTPGIQGSSYTKYFPKPIYDLIKSRMHGIFVFLFQEPLLLIARLRLILLLLHLGRQSFPRTTRMIMKTMRIVRLQYDFLKGFVLHSQLLTQRRVPIVLGTTCNFSTAQLQHPHRLQPRYVDLQLHNHLNRVDVL